MLAIISGPMARKVTPPLDASEPLIGQPASLSFFFCCLTLPELLPLGHLQGLVLSPHLASLLRYGGRCSCVTYRGRIATAFLIAPPTYATDANVIGCVFV